MYMYISIYMKIVYACMLVQMYKCVTINEHGHKY